MTAKEFEDILRDNILPFWMDRMLDTEHGGFYGRIDGHNTRHPRAHKGAVLNARILWTFAAAYRTFGAPEYRTVADRAFNYFTTYFMDEVHGGVYWEVDYQGTPTQCKKQLYAQAFALYGLSEYHRATGHPDALKRCQALFQRIELTADRQWGGYFEAFTNDWQPITDMRLSAKDANEKKSMNTHLHILESYTNLYRIWPNASVAAAQRKLINLFLARIMDVRTAHLNLFFAEDWTVKSTAISYGHDIEASWLLLEAAALIGDPDLLHRVAPAANDIAKAAAEGIQPDGSLAYEREGAHLDTDRHWWVQAEAVAGWTYAYKRTDEPAFLQYATKTWQYIQAQLVDHADGEWYWSRKENGTIDKSQDKAGPWKCPYHNGRLCLAMMQDFELTK